MAQDNEKTGTPVGTIVDGRYEILSPIGAGGMGEVLLAADNSLEREKIVIKILFPNVSRQKSLLARFKNEVLLARKLSHPNIVRIYDFGETDIGQHYLTMEYVEGKSLAHCIETPEIKEKLSFYKAVQILYAIADALGYAHSKGVVHRDLKPDNVLLSNAGEIKITDFGVARSTLEDKGLTMTGEMVGTPYYMAPEQFRGDKIDGRADIYSFGIFAYELATGKVPFIHENYVGLCALHLTEPLPPLEAPGVPSWFQDFVENCCEKEPSARFQTMAEVAVALSDHIERDQDPILLDGSPPRRSTVVGRKSIFQTIFGFGKGE